MRLAKSEASFPHRIEKLSLYESHVWRVEEAVEEAGAWYIPIVTRQIDAPSVNLSHPCCSHLKRDEEVNRVGSRIHAIIWRLKTAPEGDPAQLILTTYPLK